MINREATIRWKGYDPDDLAPNSHSKVWAVCERCDRGRWVRKQQYRKLCFSCSRARGWKHTEESKQKIRDSKTGENNPMHGKPQTDEHKAKISAANKGKHVGKDHHMYGKHHTPETIKKMTKYGAEASNWKGGPVKKICKWCGGEFDVAKYVADITFFCKRSCWAKWASKNRRGEDNPAWRGGVSFIPYCPKFNNAFKESIREKFGRVCFLCPTTEEENNQKLSVHHVRYNKDSLCDESEQVFVPLCRRCHSKTNYNREYWEDLIIQKMDVAS